MDWIFSHIDDLDAEAAMDISEGRSAADSISESIPVGPKVRDGPGSECPLKPEQAWWDLARWLHQVCFPGVVGGGGQGAEASFHQLDSWRWVPRTRESLWAQCMPPVP